jgi:hypothetical protein
MLNTLPGPLARELAPEDVLPTHSGVPRAVEIERAVARDEGVHLVAGGVHLVAHVLRHAPGIAQVVAEPDVGAAMTTRTIAGEIQPAPVR